MILKSNLVTIFKPFVMKQIYIVILIFNFLNVYSQKKWSLNELIDYANRNNIQVLQNTYYTQLQTKNLEIANREKLPFITGSFGNIISLGQEQDIFGTIKRNDNFNNSAAINGSILVFNNRRLQKAICKAEYDLQSSQLETEVIKKNISLQIVQQYLSIMLSKEILKINLSAYENAKSIYNKAEITTKSGATSQIVLAEAQASLSRENQNVENAKININRNLFQLAQLLQLPDYKNFDIQDIEIGTILYNKDFEDENILEVLYQNDPSIKAAKIRIKAAEAQTEVTKTAFWPSITASGRIGTFYFKSLVNDENSSIKKSLPNQEDGFFKQYLKNSGHQISLIFNIPIFNKGITRINIEKSKINEELMKISHEHAKNNLIQNIKDLKFNIEASYQNYLAALITEKTSMTALYFAQESYDSGRTSIYDLATARKNYANVQSALAQAKYNYFFSLKQLDFYLGKL